MAEEFTPADVATTRDYDVTGRRIVAALIDFVPLIIVFSIMVATMGESETSEDGGFTFNLNGWPAALFLLIAWAYYLVSESLTAMTPGKWLMGLKVVRLDGGGRYDFRACLLRNIVRIVDVLPVFYLVGLVSVAVTKKNQRLGDLAAGTLVVRTQ